jgi:hypothetical protein
MSEYRNAAKKVCPASLVLPLVRQVSPASAFRHRCQSGTAGHGLIRQCPAMVLWLCFCISLAVFFLRFGSGSKFGVRNFESQLSVQYNILKLSNQRINQMFVPVCSLTTYKTYRYGTETALKVAEFSFHLNSGVVSLHGGNFIHNWRRSPVRIWQHWNTGNP